MDALLERQTNEALYKGFLDAMAEPSLDLTNYARGQAGFGSYAEDISRAILKAAGVDIADPLAKAISTATGLVAFDLQAPAKNLYPVATPIRNRLPRVGGGTGTATNWRQVSNITGSGYDANGFVPEGQRAGQMSYTTANKSASYATLGEEDQVTFEAINAAQGFEDLQATMAMRLLQKTMLKEEFALLGGNNSLALGTPGTITLSASGTGSSLTNTQFSVVVVALTLQGWRNSSVAGGVATQKTVTGADGKTFTTFGGSSNKSANATITPTANQHIFASVPAVAGAAAYAWFWYAGAGGAEVLGAITTINSVDIAALATGTQTSAAVTADSSADPNAFDGLLTVALKAANGAYVKTLATGTAGTGTVLTAGTRGTVVEIDDMLQNMWDNFQVSPTVLFVNSQQIRNITDKVLINGASSLLQYRQDPAGGGYQLDAGGIISTYYNPFLLDGGQRIPVKIHPYVPPGTIIGWCENLPAQYMSTEVPNVAEVKMRQDYYALDWPPVTRSRQKGVYVEEVLAVYAPFAMGVINNIAKG